MLQIVLLCGLGVVVVYLVWRRKTPFDDIPGPKPYPLVGNIPQLDRSKIYLGLTDWAVQYGGVYKLYLFSKPVVVVSDQRFIHDVLVKQSADFDGRPSSFRMDLMRETMAGIGLLNPGRALTGHKKVVVSFIKQYSSGIQGPQKIEEITQLATDDLIARFAELNGQPVDVSEHMYYCMTDIIAIMVVGKSISAGEINGIKNNLDQLTKTMMAANGVLLDMFPFLRFFGNKTYAELLLVISNRDELMQKLIESEPADGFLSVMFNLSGSEKQQKHLDTDLSQINLAYEFFVAGIVSVATILTCLMNVLCHHPSIQEKLRQEVREVIGPSRHPTLDDQRHCPYLRATLLEIGRYATVGALTLPHKTTRTCKLGEYVIPQDTEVWVNLWALHHDETLWDEAFTFRPARFLDADGQLVAADHPNRKNMMIFGGGNRKCAGEVLAESRMFLITANILQHFTIQPESSLAEQPTCDPREAEEGLVLFPKPFKVRLVQDSH